MSRIVLLMLSAVLLPSLLVAAEEKESSGVIRVGMIGLDTSHVVRFTDIINAAKSGPAHRFKVVAAYPGGSPDLPISADRIEGFTKTLREKYQVEMVDSIEKLLKRVDVILLESVDGRPHLEQARPVIEAGKPLFIDKPIAASLADTIEIYELAARHKVPCFSSSSLRFKDTLHDLRGGNEEIGKLVRCDAFGPIKPLKGHPDLAFYGLHGIEMLFTVMGPGCKSVTWQKDGLVKGEWADGRVGTFSEGKYQVKVTGSKGATESGGGSYGPLITEVCKFFDSGKPPVSAEETINLFAFMVAAEQSRDRGHVAVSIQDVMDQARSVIRKRNAGR